MLHQIADFLSHLLRNIVSVVCFKYIGHAALAGLAVYSDYIGLVFSAYIMRIYQQVRARPLVRVICFNMVHSLGNSVLM